MCLIIEIFRFGLLGLLGIGFLYYYYYTETDATEISTKTSTKKFVMPKRATKPEPKDEKSKSTSKRPTKIQCPNHYKMRHANKFYFCYLNSYSLKRWKGHATYTMLDIPVCLCTHIIYSFAGVSDTGEVLGLKEKSYRNSRNNFEDFVEMRKRYPPIKLMLSLGGQDVQILENFTKVIKDFVLRRILTKNIMSLMKKHKLAGLDLYYPDPIAEGAKMVDFVNLCKQLRTKFGKRYLLTAFSVPAIKTDFPHMDVEKLNIYLDYFLLRTFDFYDVSNNVGLTGGNLMYKMRDVQFNMDSLVDAWLDFGAFRNKTVIGISLHANTFEVDNKPSLDNSEIKHRGYGPLPGAYRGLIERWTFMEVCETTLNFTKWQLQERDSNYASAYSKRDRHYMTFENVQSAYAKGRYASLNQFPGIVINSVDEDDFGGYCELRLCTICQDYKYPLIHAAIKGFESFDENDVKTSL